MPSPKPQVLFLAANPELTHKLALDQECAAITRELKMTPGRTEIDFQTRWAVTVDDLMRELNEIHPTLIHFSGHGNAQGIALIGADGMAQLVSPKSLVAMIESVHGSERGPTCPVVLNACYSDEQAEVLAEELGCAIGMRGAIHDEAAREFSIALYRALGHGRSLYTAFRQARAVLAAKGLDQRASPQCKTRADVDARQFTLTREQPAEPAPRMASGSSAPSHGTPAGTSVGSPASPVTIQISQGGTTTQTSVGPNSTIGSNNGSTIGSNNGSTIGSNSGNHIGPNSGTITFGGGK